jgi:hypothetical protein
MPLTAVRAARVTATLTITSTFIETARRRVDGTASDAVSAKLDQIVARLDVIDGDLRASAGATAMSLNEARGAA